MREDRAAAALVRVVPLVRRCHAAAARGDSEAAWVAYVARRVTATMVGVPAPGEPPQGRVVYERAAPAASAQAAAPDLEEGRLRKREAALRAALREVDVPEVQLRVCPSPGVVEWRGCWPPSRYACAASAWSSLSAGETSGTPGVQKGGQRGAAGSTLWSAPRMPSRSVRR